MYCQKVPALCNRIGKACIAAPIIWYFVWFCAKGCDNKFLWCFLYCFRCEHHRFPSFDLAHFFPVLNSFLICTIIEQESIFTGWYDGMQLHRQLLFTDVQWSNYWNSFHEKTILFIWLHVCFAKFYCKKLKCKLPTITFYSFFFVQYEKNTCAS